MPGTHRWKLFLMMVLQFFIWGAWLPLVFGYIDSLGFSKGQQAAILDAFPIAAIVGMVFSNQFADRNFAAERFLAASHLIGGFAMLGLGFTREFWPFAILMYLHCLVYVPTISITNAIAFTHLKDAQREFGFVRMGGTIGWIIVSWPFIFLLSEKAGASETKWVFIVAGIISFVLAAFSLTLPHTPPRRDVSGTDRVAWIKALVLLANPFVLILFVATFIDATIHNGYFVVIDGFLQKVGISANMSMVVSSIGQVAEIVTMLILGVTLKNLGWRTTMIVGILGHAARFAVFAFFPDQQAFVILINVLHGICYAFFFATVYIFVDEFFPKDVRASAQGLFNLMILGFGPLVANVIGPRLIGETFRTVDAVDFRSLFLVPCIAALAAAVTLALLFHPPRHARGLRVIHEKVHRVARTGAIPVVLGGCGDGTARGGPPTGSHRCTRCLSRPRTSGCAAAA